MAPALYQQFTSPLTQGTPQYAQAAVEQAQKATQPAYQQALEANKQQMANRGMLNSGLTAQNESGITNEYLNNLANTATQTAMGQAQQGFQANQAELQRQFQQQMMQQQLQQQAGEFQQQQEAQKAGMWGNLIGAGAQAASPLVSALIPKPTPTYNFNMGAAGGG